MRFIIHNGEDFEKEDSVIIEGDTIEEARTNTQAEASKRGWKEEKCWSERIAD